jgi:hypothetical protein
MAVGSATPPAEEPPEPGSGDPEGGPAGAAPGEGAGAAPGEGAGAAPGEGAGAAPGEEERYGPLRVRRTRKDDGRALTLYSDARRGHSCIDDERGERAEPAA